MFLALAPGSVWLSAGCLFADFPHSLIVPFNLRKAAPGSAQRDGWTGLQATWVRDQKEHLEPLGARREEGRVHPCSITAFPALGKHQGMPSTEDGCSHVPLCYPSQSSQHPHVTEDETETQRGLLKETQHGQVLIAPTPGLRPSHTHLHFSSREDLGSDLAQACCDEGCSLSPH